MRGCFQKQVLHCQRRARVVGFFFECRRYVADSGMLRDWSLITGRGGGLQNGGGGWHVKFYPYKRGGGGKSFSHPDGGGGGAQTVLRYF